MDLQLAGLNVLVTGAGQGLGRALGMGFAAEGANVAFHFNSSASGAEKAAAEATELGVRAIAVGGDLRSAAEVAALVERTESELGPIGVLVNNAAATKVQRFLDSTPADWAPQIDVTVTGTLQLTHAVAKRMAERKAGAIVNLMGDSGRIGESGLLVTATARSTTVGLTRSLAKELARFGIRTNAVSLALVRTDNFDEHSGGADADDERTKKILAQYPLRRLGRPDDITPMVLLLASPLSSWTTGQVVSVNGGYAMP
ncbi:MAG: 2-hydroxycyclohexanecarboxyl-CoA dehydrogenase [Pseudonocardiales bacterium]|jgi:3-oxoacyl-[acyl-carrier protein] reductase|nr:2-hydroxycyclohexanecarboxyl-CoA dehydrogenase [Pseudonocardiales bacterium]MDT7585769.1 2-hydroxycyclohexanecarboxyl-CoA dehydrogenase [Pseudonocardiales bacterium]MDT7627157.1 2-hydroxycyclohexanecarboxyl-CoA dehydrogenase [Pseudonocardiales bacterium]MDT7637289.1 2-hydroxycyclohexanecarboxyl-CoA dehydrogenase [Pseudonocardiales bacterium]MDT7676046.1 2-hydroxycyclohexanecarboxyl-CoA dehydrogenase [Pseudonocardiales bacterium]